MTPFKKQQVMTAARAEFARSPELQDEFSDPEIYAAFAVAEKAGLIRARHHEEKPSAALDADRQAFLGTYTRILANHPEFRDLWPGGFDQAFEHHVKSQQLRAATVAFGVPTATTPTATATPITARTIARRQRMPH